MSELEEAVTTVVERCLRVRAGETVLVVADPDNILEDEKILGTVHVAFGASAGIGGTVTVPVHLDVVVTEPTLWIGDTQVLDAGGWLLA